MKKNRNNFFQESVVWVVIFSLITLPVFTSCGGGGGSGDEPTSDATSEEIYNDYNTSVASMVQSHETFVTALYALHVADLDTLSSDEIDELLDDFIVSGNAWVDAGYTLNAEADRVNKLRSVSSFNGAASLSAELGAGELGDVANLMENIIKRRDQLREQYPEWDDPGSADNIFYTQELQKLADEARVEGTGKVLIVGGSVVGGIIGTAGAKILIGLGVASTAPGWAVLLIGGCAGAVVVGGGTAIYVWFSSDDTSLNKNMDAVMNVAQNADEPVLFSASVNKNEPFPMMDSGPGTLTISIPGAVPIIIDDFQPPAEGQQISINCPCAAVDEDQKSEAVIEESEITVSPCIDVSPDNILSDVYALECPVPEIDNDDDGQDQTSEFVIWYTDNVRCWGAPWLYINSRDDFEQTDYRCNYEGGGIDCTQELVKTEIQGNFTTSEEASDWICPKITGAHFSYWCGGSRAHWVVSGQVLDFRLGNLGCGDLSHLPDLPYPDPHPGM